MNTNHATTAAPTTTTDDPTLWRVDEALWAEVPPLLVIDQPRNDDRPIFAGLVWLARTGGRGATLPRAFGAKATVPARCLAGGASGCCAHAWARLLAVYDDEGAGRAGAGRCRRSGQGTAGRKKQWSWLSRGQAG